jgi:hypothetical protein
MAAWQRDHRSSSCVADGQDSKSPSRQQGEMLKAVILVKNIVIYAIF